MISVKSFAAGLCLACLAAGGCGGNNSSFDQGPISNANGLNNNLPNQPNSGDIGVFLTDNLSDKYDHVWMSIKQIDLKLASGGTRTIFADNRGLGVDLASLHDAAGPKYKFVNELTMPTGTYTAALITVEPSALVFPTNASTGKEMTFAGQQAGSKDTVLTVTFDPPKLLGAGHDDLVLDFDLSQWKDDNGKLAALIIPSLGAGLEDADRNAPAVASGTVSDLKGEVPSQTFTLKSGKFDGMAVSTEPTTALISLPGATGPAVLTKDQAVEVTGVFDVNTRKFDAASIRILDPKAPARDELYGTINTVDLKAGTWVVSPSDTRGVLPDSLGVSVKPSDGARFYSSSGLSLEKAAFISDLSASSSVHVLVSGVYDPTKNSFVASEARLQDPDSQPEIKLSGVIVDPKTDDQTFGLTVTDYEGLLTKPGVGETVAITPETKFTDEGGKSLTSQAFYGVLSSPKAANVDGTLDTSTNRILATTVKLAPAPVNITPKKKKKTR